MTNNMKKTTIDNIPTFKSSQFRNPSVPERKLNLWLDRVGENKEKGIQTKLRILGLYGAVKFEGSPGYFVNSITGKERLCDGDIVLLFPDIPAMYYPDKSWQAKWILWDGPESDSFRELGYLNPEKPVIKSYTRFSEFHTALSKNIAREDLSAALERKNIISSLVQDIFRAVNSTEKGSENSMEDVVKFINTQDADLTVEELAEQFNYSCTHFRRLFKAYTGSSPKEYLTSAKINKAKKLLLDGKPIKDIANTLGFCDVFHFMRTFKKVAGVNAGKFN
ncbi:MAG: AraC family transcriptional regulator [Planctomycetota bacterium]